MAHRAHEEDKTRFRTDRFYTINNKWYFASRENDNIGPFSNLSEARKALRLYLETIKHHQYTEEYAENLAKNGPWATTYYQ